MLARLRHPAHPLLLLGFVLLLAVAVTMSASVVHLDATMGRIIRATVGDISLQPGFLVSTLASTNLVLPLTAAAALALCLLRHWGGALTLALAVLGTQAVVDLIKLLVERPRPALNGTMAEASGYSFPSAHSATGMALYATLTLLAARATSGRLRVAIVAGGTALIGAIGLSRVMLAAHYPIDVVAGWMTGGAVLLASWLLVRRVGLRMPRAQPA
jgi:membrane-associated phospholipid phosphatase